MKRITSALLALVLVVCMFTLTSCEEDAKTLLENAAKALTETPYIMTMKLDFTSDNAEVNEVLGMMNMEIPVTIDGENLYMDMSVDVMGQSVSTKMTLVDKVLYYDISLAGISQKMKATLSDSELAEFMGKQSVEMPIDYSQFAELTAEVKDGKTIITCSGITDEGKKALNDEMAATLEALGGSVELENLSYTLTLEDGKFEAMDLSCTYTVSIEGETVSTTMNMGTTFKYEDVDPITVPADADSYSSVDYGSMLGA